MPAKPADIFRRNVAHVIGERGITMEELAKACKTSRPNISRILSGDEQVSLERAGRIAKALDLPLSELVSPTMKILEKIA